MVDKLQSKAQAVLKSRDLWSGGTDAVIKTIKADVLHRILVQNHLVHSFFHLADELGFPIDGSAPEGAEEVLQRANKGDSGDFVPTPAFALAQHHAIKTFLLDWTWSPLVAAFTAANVPIADSKDLAVWALDQSKLPDTGLEKYQCPRHARSYIHAQQGLFVHVKNPIDTFFNRGKQWLQFDDFVWEKDPTAIRCLTLPSDQAKSLLQILWQEGVSRARLMPTLDNVALVAMRPFSGSEGPAEP